MEDLPYVELNDWAKLLYFVNTDNGDEDYDLSIETKDDVVTYERENGYTASFDFKNDTLHYMDYDAFIHGSDDSTLIDLVSEKGTDEQGNAELIWRDKQASFDRYGDEMTVDLGACGIHMIAQDGGYYVPLQTLNDFTLLNAQVSFLFNGQALILASDSLFYDYGEQKYNEISDIYYSAPTGERSDALAEYSYNELCLLLDTFYGLKDAHDIQSFRELFRQIGYDEALSGKSAAARTRPSSPSSTTARRSPLVFDEYSYLTGMRRGQQQGHGKPQDGGRTGPSTAMPGTRLIRTAFSGMRRSATPPISPLTASAPATAVPPTTPPRRTGKSLATPSPRSSRPTSRSPAREAPSRT